MTRRLAVVGGGSPYLPVVFDALLGLPGELPVDEVLLADPDTCQLKIVGGFCQRLVASSGSRLRVELVDSISGMLRGTDIVLAFFRAGGLEARHLDETFPLQYGLIGQETQGFGGFASALRNIAVLRELAKEMREACPNALLLVATNPVGIVTGAAHRLGLHAVGICEQPYQMRASICRALEAPDESVEVDYVGLNHLGWVVGAKVDGQSIALHDFLSKAQDILDGSRPANIPWTDLDLVLARGMRALPCPYLTYYYHRKRMVDHLKGQEKSRAQVVADLNRRLLERYAAGESSDWRSLAERRGGFALGAAIAALLDDLLGDDTKSRRHFICQRNAGRLPFLSDDAVVEAPARIVDGAFAHVMAPFSPPHHIRGLMSVVAAYEQGVVEAAISGDYEKALMSLAIHPLVPDVTTARALLDMTIAACGAYLPQFVGSEGTGSNSMGHGGESR